MRTCPQCNSPAERKAINARTVQIKCTKCSWSTNKTYAAKGRSG